MELATLLMERCLPEALQPLAGARAGPPCGPGWSAAAAAGWMTA